MNTATETHYEAWYACQIAERTAKEDLATLTAVRTSAAMAVKNTTIGIPLAERMKAVNATISSFAEQIEKIEQAIAEYRVKGDVEWEAYEAERLGEGKIIEVDDTHRIEVSASGMFYPQHITNIYTNAPGTRWAYYRKGDRAQTCRSYATERAARKFIAANA